MKRYLLLINTFIIAICLFFSSCKDTTHYPHPGAGNVRLASYSLVGTSTYTLSAASNSTENDNYAFSYDSLNRVSYVTFTTNNPFKSNKDITFIYSADTIYKITTSVTPSIAIEKDTFIVNSLGQLAIAFTPNTSTTFQYYENLLTKVITTNESLQTSVTTTYTSVVGDFINGISTAGSTANQSFVYYTEYTSRIADYYQLQSFTMYGINIYQYNHLVRSVTQGTQVMTFTYNIDAYSNVTSERAETKSTTGNDTTTVYSFQYENY